MVNLVPAKCPSCGAQLELDDNMKRAECKFCKSTIIVDDAIEKYKLEISGNVKVSGIQGESDKIDIARKYIKLDKYEEAQKIINEILEKNPFYLEAIKMLIEIEKKDCEDALNGKLTKNIWIEIDKNDYENTHNSKFTKRIVSNPKLDKYSKLVKDIRNKTMGEIVKNIINDCLDKLTTIEKLDESHEYDNFVKEYKNTFDELSKKTDEFIKKENERQAIFNQKYEKDEAMKKELIEKCNIYLKKVPKKKPNKNIPLLLQALKIDITKYGKNMCMIDTYNTYEDAAGGGYFIDYHAPQPYIKSINWFGITIGGIMLSDEKNPDTNEYKYYDYYDKSQISYEGDKKFGYNSYLYKIISFEREENIPYEEQISILDDLIASTSIKSKINNLFK